MATDKPFQSLEIAEPCPAAWAEMAGIGAARHCGKCNRSVHDLSAMAPEAAEELLARTASAGVCVRVRCDSDGVVLHAPGAQRTAHRRLRLLSPALLAAMAACSTGSESEPQLVLESPPAAAPRESALPTPEPARESSPDATESPVSGTQSTPETVPHRVSKTPKGRRAPELRTHLVMGVLAPGQKPPRSPLQGVAPEAERAAAERSEFDFGI